MCQYVIMYNCTIIFSVYTKLIISQVKNRQQSLEMDFLW